MIALALGVGLCIILSAVNIGLLLLLLQRKPEKAKIGRPRGSRNRPAQTLVEQAKEYFGPVAVKEPPSAEEIAALVRFVNEGDIAAQSDMVDPNDEFRTGTQYAGT